MTCGPSSRVSLVCLFYLFKAGGLSTTFRKLLLLKYNRDSHRGEIQETIKE